MASEFEHLYEAAEQVIALIAPLKRWEQEIVLDIASSLRAHRSIAATKATLKNDLAQARSIVDQANQRVV
jgi:hypothetical protein